jgi:hypothetical protein
MSATESTRLAAAEVNWGRDPRAVLWVGNRAVHQYWALLAPYFRDVMLVPQRRSEDEITAWSWHESQEGRTPTGAELAALRKRLTNDLRAFTDNASDQATSEAGVGKTTNQTSIAQLAAAMEGWGLRLVGMSDSDLARFVACTESGLRLHSWGLTTAAVPFYPDERKAEKKGIAAAPGEREAAAEATRPAKKRRLRRRWILLLILLMGTGVGGTAIHRGWLAMDSADQREESVDTDARWREAGRFSLSKLWTRLVQATTGSRERGPGDGSVKTDPVSDRGSRTTDRGAGGRGEASVAKDTERRSTPGTEGNSASGLVAPASGLPGQARGLPAASSAATPSTPSGAGAGVGSSAGAAGTGGGSDGADGEGASPASSVAATAGNSQQQNNHVPGAPRTSLSPTDPASGLEGSSDQSESEPKASESLPDRREHTDPEGESDEATARSKDGRATAGEPAKGRDDAEGPDLPALRENPTADGQVDVAQSRHRPADKTSDTTESSDDDGEESDSGSDKSARDDALPGKPVQAVFFESHAANPEAITEMEWDRVVAVNESRWQVRLLGESILPTQPMRVGTTETIESLRTKAWKEREATLPAAFANIRGRRGYGVERAGADLRWRMPSAGKSGVTRTSAGRAEISWTEEDSVPSGIHEVVDERDRLVARVEIDGAGSMLVSLAEGVQGSLWFQIDGDVASFIGRRFSETTMPAGWRWSAYGNGVRLEVPLPARAGTNAGEMVALLDPVSGWAIVKRIRLGATATER